MEHPHVLDLANDLSAKIRHLVALSAAVATMASGVPCADQAMGNVIVLAELAHDVAEKAESRVDEILDVMESKTA